jgi:predicted ATPase
MQSIDESKLLGGDGDTQVTEQSFSSVETSQEFSTRRESSCTGERSASILRTHKERVSNKNVDALTINKLRFSAVGLVGRGKEAAVLAPCLDRVNDSDQKGRELVLISGYSGTGKTALALSIANQVKKRNGMIASGKFNQYSLGEPYFGVSAACQEIFENIMSMNAKEAEAIRTKIITELGAEIHVLTSVIPALSLMISGDEQVVQADLGNQGDLEAQNQQIHYAFRLLIRVVSSYFAPLVIVINDLQWADAASLELLQVLMTDRENSGFMVIGTFRSNRVDEDHALSGTIRNLRDKSLRDGFGVSEIEIGNLAVPELNQIIMSLLSIDDEFRTLELAELCHKRTQGNVFFFIIFVTMLHNEGLLEFGLGLFEWKWDVAEIEKRTSSTANVVELMTDKMNKLPDQVVHFLQVAACLGSTVDERMINLVWRNSVTDGVVPQGKGVAFKPLLTQVVEENFLEAAGPSHYRWVHDNVQEAALSLTPTDQLVSIQFDIGTILARELDEHELDAAIFVVVNLVNKKFESMENAVNVEIARLNLRAAEKAKGGSAFESAAKYAVAGISLLPEAKWKNHFKLTLDLYSVGAEASGIRGQTNVMEVYCDEVLNQKDCSIFDKLRVYHILMDSLGNGGRLQEALKLCLNVLEQLDCKFPKREVARVARVVATIFKIKGEKNIPTADDIKMLPQMANPEKVESMNLMKRLGTYSYMTGNTMLMVLVLTRQVRWTMRYGLSAYSPPAFNGYGMILMSVLGDFDLGTKYADYALLMLEILETKATESATLYGSYSLILPWKRPVHASIKPFLHGYKVGMQVGDTESAAQCLSNLIFTLLVSGKSLRGIDADCRIFVPQMEELKRLGTADITRVLWQTALNLMGRSSRANILSGEAMDENEILERARATNGEKFMTNVIDGLKSFLYAYLGEHRLGAELAIAKGDKFLKELPCAMFGMSETFSRGITLYAMARKTNKRKFKKHAIQVKKTIKSWVDGGNPNVKHHLCLLNAEQAALDGKEDLARALYGKAVILAARGGFLHDAALASERFADFVHRYDRDEATFRLEESIRFYTEWGATRKVEMLRIRLTAIPSEIHLEADKSSLLDLPLV